MKSTDLTAGLGVSIGGAALDPTLLGQLLETRVETTTGLPDVCTLRFAEADAAGSADLKIIDSPKFALGAPLSVKLASPVGTGGPKPVFDGEITTVEAEFGARPGGTPVLELIVTGHDRSHRMHRRTTTRTLRQVTVSDVARKIAQEHGLKLGTLATIATEPMEVVHQVGESDWTFLSRLVSRNGGELDIAGGALHIIDPAKAASPVAELIYGESLERFRPRISTVGQVGKVSVYGWDPNAKREIVQTAIAKASTSIEKSKIDGAVGSGIVVVVKSPVSTTGDAKAAAAAIANHVGHERVQGEAVAAGDPLLLAGAYVTISGVGKRFGGVHRIVSAVHIYGDRGYQTRLTLGAGGKPLAQTMGTQRGGATQFADHLVIGIVTSNDDPDKLGRIKVRYPALGGDQVESGWARTVHGAAGLERGTVALPHVNDEVVVAFQQGDPRRPYVLGVVFNGRDTPGADLVKATSSFAARFPRDLDVATKEKVLVDGARGVTVKSTKGPFELAANTEIKLTAGAAGSPSPITIETTGQIKANGKQGVEISASGPLKITSTAPVTVESSAALQLKGTAVQVQATGVLQLSGASVMLG